MSRLTEKRKAFAEHYCSDCVGNAHRAAIAAGYSPATAIGHSHKLLKDKAVLKYIECLNAAIAEAMELTPSGTSPAPSSPTPVSPRVSSIADIQAFWSETMNDPGESMKNRLKASELLAKSKGMFNSDW